MNWIAIAAASVLLTIGVVKVVNAGVRERDAEPARLVVEKSHTTSSYSCGKSCVGTSDHYTLFAADGGTCSVSRREWARVPRGTAWKCEQLFGWSD
jgi:hypothetical protein